MKKFWVLAIAAAAVLSGAAVWMGGLNQDEGWYLYAANLIAEGKVPYGDFFFTQGPVMPTIYEGFTWVWQKWGLLGARVFTLLIGVFGIYIAVVLAHQLAPKERKSEAAIITFMLLGCNLYHLYYVAIPKTYALAEWFVLTGFFILMLLGNRHMAIRYLGAGLSGLVFAFATGTRISLGVLLVAVELWLLIGFRRHRFAFLWFGLGAFIGLWLVYGGYLCHPSTRAGLLAAQQYHAARGGFDLVWVVGSFSRLVRWYLPVFIVLGLGWGIKVEKKGGGEQWNMLLLFSFLAVFAVQMLAPFPYEDYQVPIMGLLAVYAAVSFVSCNRTIEQSNNLGMLLVLGLSFANAFGSPLLEKWATNGQDRFWSIKKERFELAELRDTAARIEALDPGGTEIFTQDLYLAIETGRRVPKGLEMGPFSILSDDEWRALLKRPPCRIAALSGYTFAIDPPQCDERPLGRQLDYWSEVRRNYELQFKVPRFGQGATPLLVLRSRE